MDALSDDQLKRLKAIELEILDEFLRICNKYQLNYFLSGGTCLGAVRHGGFIPWDDDIDISMPRIDYDKFVRVAVSELNPTFVLQCYETESNCGLVFGKIRKKGTVYSEVYSHHIDMSQGVWIDVFPYDALPEEDKAQKRHYRKVMFWKNLYIVKCGYGLPLRSGIALKAAYMGAKIACRFIPRSWVLKRLDAAMRAYDDMPADWYFPYGGAYSFEKERMLGYDLYSYVRFDFEGRSCNVLKDYDRYLTSLYGDYLTLPPVEKRRAGVHNVYEFREEM